MTDAPNFSVLVKALLRRELTIGAAESLTGGLFGYLLTREEGAGDVFRGSLVTYQTAAKRRVLGIETQSSRRRPPKIWRGRHSTDSAVTSPWA